MSQPPEQSRTAVGTPAGGGLRVGFLGLTGVLGLSVVALITQARTTVKVVQRAAMSAAVADGIVPAGLEVNDMTVCHLPVPRADGVYLPSGQLRPVGVDRPGFSGPAPLVLAMLGDSTAVGYGTRSAAEVPGVLLARGLAAQLGRPIWLRTYGLCGCGAADLPRQIAAALPDAPDIVIIVVGANDIRDRVAPGKSADYLGAAVLTLRAKNIPVVVGTCPDFGVIEPIPQPLRSVLHTWSVLLAALQERAVRAAGGRSVAVGRLVRPEFLHHPEMFAGDHFHPSGAGYARAVATLLPCALQELQGVLTTNALSREPG